MSPFNPDNPFVSFEIKSIICLWKLFLPLLCVNYNHVFCFINDFACELLLVSNIDSGCIPTYQFAFQQSFYGHHSFCFLSRVDCFLRKPKLHKVLLHLCFVVTLQLNTSFLGSAAAAAGLAVSGYPLWAGESASKQPGKDASTQPKQRYKIAVCDWMILKRQKLGAFELTKKIGADGVEVDMGSLGDRETFASALADPKVRQQFLDTAKELDLEICSLAMSGFYAQSFAERPTVYRMVQDCIDTMKLMNVKVAFLPLGVRGDLVKHPELRPAIVERLKAIGLQLSG